MGVSYDLFWTLNPKSLSPFIKAFRLQQEHEDTKMWIQGQYILMAIGSAMNKDSKYPKEPLFMSNKKQKLSQQEIIKRRFELQMEVVNTRFSEVTTNE